MENNECVCGSKKLNIGCGRLRKEGYINIDIMQMTDGNGDKMVDCVRDIEKVGLPVCDNSCDHIIADNVLEHISNLEFLMNECWRALKPGGHLEGIVPLAGTDGAWRDPTHKRLFVVSTFSYFTGHNLADPTKPGHPKYADYGFLPWDEIVVERPQDNGNIHFILTPRKS